MPDTRPADYKFLPDSKWARTFYKMVPFNFEIQRSDDGFKHDLSLLKPENFGDRKSVGDGVWELRLAFGPGYRIYYGEVDNTIVLLLCGGDKSSQRRDIERAKNYWKEYKERP